MELAAFLAGRPAGDLWVFGYGSLMWSPGFSHSQSAMGRAHGFHRALCILSNRHRGTPERPGLVVGLCRGGSCWGMVFRIPAHKVRRTLAVLWRREMLNNVYIPTMISVAINRRRRVRALAFVADTAHRQFVRELDLHGRARLVAQGIGRRGRCVDYIRNTLEHIAALGLRDPHLERVLSAASALGMEALHEMATR
ncbi:MAG: gamma-glutamylcyclotransferase [Betaproteobacteria bacterium]|nr:gamma-glutamylcyclotransferase [Betaproteobacteria bacterium]